MSTMSVDELTRNPAGLIDRLAAGEHVVIERDGVPMAAVQPIAPPRNALRPYGLAAGEFTVPDDFDDPLPEEIQRHFEGR